MRLPTDVDARLLQLARYKARHQHDDATATAADLVVTGEMTLLVAFGREALIVQIGEDILPLLNGLAARSGYGCEELLASLLVDAIARAVAESPFSTKPLLN